MATSQNTYVLDRRAAYQPAWLPDSDLDDDPPSPEWPFDSIPGARASLESSLDTTPHAELSARAPVRRAAATAAMAIAAAMVMTFGVGWWVGRVHPPRDEGPSLARTARGSAKAVRAEAQTAPALFTIVTAREALAVPLWRPSPAPAPRAPVTPIAPMPRLAPVASIASIAPEKPAEPVAPVFVPTEL
jgi:hypothetical protein